jgi:hypothetical protein
MHQLEDHPNQRMEDRMSPTPQERKGPIDSAPDQPGLLNLAGFYAKRQLPERGVVSEVV